MEEIPKAEDAALAKAIDRSGIMEGAAQDLPEAQPPKEEKPETPEPKPEPKPESKPDEGDEEDEEEGDEKGEEETPSKETPPAKKVSRPLKAVFTQIGELRTILKDLSETVKSGKTSPKAEAATEVVDDALKGLMQEAEEKGADPEFIKSLATTLMKQIKSDLEKEGLLRKDLPADIQERLKLLDTLQAERQTTAQAQQFDGEWGALIPEIKKQFPNAGDKELAEAKKIMADLAHSEKGGVVIDKKNNIIKGYPLDYILFQNRKAFETILKVAKGKTSGEGASRDIENVEGDDEEIDTDPETMNPAKFKRLQKQKIKDSIADRKPEFIG